VTATRATGADSERPWPSGVKYAGLTYFARWPAWAARLLALCVAAAIGVTALPHTSLKPPPPPSARSLFRDVDLYRATVARIDAGQDYYAAAATEQRAHSFPTSPAPVFRQPWLAWLLAILRLPFLQAAAVYPLFAVLGVLWYRELQRSQLSTPQRLAACLVLLSGFGMVGTDGASYQHEIWAAGLIALSLTLYRADRWAASVVLGFAACLFRELALPYLGVMGLFALVERRWRELAAWATAATAFCLVFGMHLLAASGLVRPGDGVSPGWVWFSGPSFAILTARWNLALHFLPDSLVAAAICLGLLGLSAWRDPRCSRAALVVGGYLAAFTVVGRPDNSNWGQLYAPLLAVGLLLAPPAVRDLIAVAGGRLAEDRREAD